MLGNKSMRKILVILSICIKMQNKWSSFKKMLPNEENIDFIMRIKAVTMDSVVKMVLVSPQAVQLSRGQFPSSPAAGKQSPKKF